MQKAYSPHPCVQPWNNGLRRNRNPRCYTQYLWVIHLSKLVLETASDLHGNIEKSKQKKKYGCNPTGMTASLKRRKEVISLAREHDFMILEGVHPIPCFFFIFIFIYFQSIDDVLTVDDPYFYLYYGEAPRYPSYFALEREEPEVGRVLRFDSLSKILSAGMRIGFASGPEPLLNAIDQCVSCLHLFPAKPKTN